mmetsp:Transcript_210/g.466  ORF Transcript_210/g.466 Transcript_210/m.466 type:complete len:320 (+) Transcript_210:293-1252(+)
MPNSRLLQERARRARPQGRRPTPTKLAQLVAPPQIGRPQDTQECHERKEREQHPRDVLARGARVPALEFHIRRRAWREGRSVCVAPSGVRNQARLHEGSVAVGARKILFVDDNPNTRVGGVDILAEVRGVVRQLRLHAHEVNHHDAHERPERQPLAIYGQLEEIGGRHALLDRWGCQAQQGADAVASQLDPICASDLRGHNNLQALAEGGEIPVLGHSEEIRHDDACRQHAPLSFCRLPERSVRPPHAVLVHGVLPHLSEDQPGEKCRAPDHKRPEDDQSHPAMPDVRPGTLRGGHPVWVVELVLQHCVGDHKDRQQVD